MKKLLLIIFILLPVFIFAQKSKPWNKEFYDKSPYHFGFSFSLGLLDFATINADNFNSLDTVYSIEGIAKPTFGANMVTNLRLSNNWDLRCTPGLLFGQRDLNYLLADVSGSDTSFYRHTMKIESTFLQVPFLIKYRAVRLNNYRPYVIFGATYSIDFAARKKIKPEDQPKIRLNRQDILLEAGFGIDYYLPYFKFSTEIRFSYGLLNIVNYDNTQYTEAFKRLGTKMVTFLIYFE